MQPSAKDVETAIETAIESQNSDTSNTEIAFFGGSFTAIDRKYMLSLLDATVPYIDSFKGIRISTRPDCINDEILMLLKEYKVTSIELGAQSMDDTVLTFNNRGHNSSDVIEACRLIKKYGFALGLQMMTGLYKSTYEKDIYTACEFIKLNPDTVRIYPTVVMKQTHLEELFLNKKYVPFGFDETVNLCSELLIMFNKSNIPVIRLGLHHSESLSTDMVAGVYHPSFRELCESKIMLDKAITLLKDKKTQEVYNLYVAPSCVSKMIGNKKNNITELSKAGYKVKIIQSDNIPYMEVALKR